MLDTSFYAKILSVVEGRRGIQMEKYFNTKQKIFNPCGRRHKRIPSPAVLKFNVSYYFSHEWFYGKTRRTTLFFFRLFGATFWKTLVNSSPESLSTTRNKHVGKLIYSLGTINTGSSTKNTSLYIEQEKKENKHVISGKDPPRFALI